MRIREYTSADFATLRSMHAAQGFGYPLPDLDSPLFITKLVLEEDGVNDAGLSGAGFSLRGSDAAEDAPAATATIQDREAATDASSPDAEASIGSRPAAESGFKQGPQAEACATKTAAPFCPCCGSRLSSDCHTEAQVNDSSWIGPYVAAENPQAEACATEPCAASGRVVMAVLLRLTAETYLLHDPDAGTPRRRWQRLLALHEAARQDAAARGLDDVQAFLPPRVARAFGRRLARLGWRRDPWTCFSKAVASGE